MGKSSSFSSILVPSLTVFFSNVCIMVLELVAGRLVARELGSSLYTWTSVIGVVLAGISIGNYIGGRIADRFQARKTLSVLFGICSVTCVGVVVLNNLVVDWVFLWYLRWPLRIFSHVCLVFLIPSMMLGAISPVVAKMALDRGLPPGRTVGDIYAWAAAGSIAGTFLAGFYLIAAMGTIPIIWTIGAALLLMAVLYWARFWVIYLWAAVFIALITTGMAPIEWAERTGADFALRAKPDPNVLYEDETQYNYIAVKQLSSSPDRRDFIQDKLVHSQIIMENITDLQYAYSQIYAAVTRRLSRQKSKLSVLVIGGGGYVFPRYVKRLWPQSHVDVAEIDPGVTEAAVRAFGLESNTTINTMTMDARNYVDEMLESQRNGRHVPQYDFIYEDAINHYSVPYQLVTKEFNDNIARFLADDGAYMINLIDMFESGLFLGSIVNTLKETFQHVYVVADALPDSYRNTFVVIAAKREINLENLGDDETIKRLDLWIFSNSDMKNLGEKAREIVLTDDYAPVENLLAPVVDQSTLDYIFSKGKDLAEELRSEGKFKQSIAVYKELLKVRPAVSIYREVAAIMIQQRQGTLEEAAELLRQAVELGKKARIRFGLAGVHLDLALAMKELKQPAKSREHFAQAIEGFQKELSKKPESIEAIAGLGIALTETGRFNDGIGYLQQAVNISPLDVQKHLMLARAFAEQKHYDKAIEKLRDSMGFMLEQGRKKEAAELQSLLEAIELEKSQYAK
ncbi:MAG TPA: fused MFS/spermidine synthase [Sedimentisphaerales bacterium]|nr:fused MFS/spermidine synthase [Sedimentisphaerales bacterium]